ncbi:ATP-binding cassette domain-containing protein [bacterium]|nr:ATP-binding cassette domain-containing protein [bacterium]
MRTKKRQADMTPLIRVNNLSKRFGTLSALRGINLSIGQGEVIGITGQSGSGKSTLAMLLAGIYPQDEGSIIFKNKTIHWPENFRTLGIEVIHQKPRLAENLDITSNIFLGNEIASSFLKNWLKIPNQLAMDQKAMALLERLQVDYTSLREQVYNLSLEKRQMIAIAQVMTSSPDLIIVDEPTQVLSYPYQKVLLNLIADWQEEGISIIFFSNNLDHLLDVTDRILVLREGYCAAEFVTEDADREEIIASLVGTTNYQQLIPIIWALDNHYQARDQASKLQFGQMLLEQEDFEQKEVYNQLVNRLTEQITAIDSTNQTLKNAQRRLITEAEEERKFLAREIHDQIIQDLLGTNYQLEEIEDKFDSVDQLQGDLFNIQENIRGMIDDLRNICGNLRPPTIDSLGLNAAIQSFTQDWSKRSGVETELDLDQSIGRLPETIELSIYRIVQEGLNNIYKHSSATKAKIALKRTSPRTLMIYIEDNGEGIDEQIALHNYSKEGHYGLLGIDERISLLGGRLRLQNKETGGLIIQAEIPRPRH